MEEQKDEQTELREFVLGAVSEERRDELELRFLADDEFHISVLAAEEELYQDYADGNLTTDELELFELRFAAREDHRRRAAFARALRKAVTDRSTSASVSFAERIRHFVFSRAFAAAALVVIVAFGGFLLWKKNADANDLVAALSRAQRGSRPANGRLVGFDYAPKSEGTRGERMPQLELSGIKARAVEAVLGGQTAANLRQLALVNLAEGDIDAAIGNLEKAVAISPNEAVIHNDLGVALTAKGGFDSATRAVEEIEKAIRLDPRLTDAYFNRALVFEQLGLNSKARQAWEDYLSRDPDSPWADEARVRLSKLSATAPVKRTREDVLREFRTHAARGDDDEAWRVLDGSRELIAGKLVSQQLAFLIVELTVAGDESGAHAALADMRFAGRLEDEHSGDLLTRDWAVALANLSPMKATSLKAAGEKYHEGVALLQKADYSGARTKLNEARQEFAAAGDVGNVHFTELILGYAANRDNDLNESSALFESAAAAGRNRRFKWLEIQGEMWLTSNDLIARRFADASDRIARVAPLADQFGDYFCRQKLLLLGGDVAMFSGDLQAALGVADRSLELNRRPESNLGESWRSLDVAIRLLVRLGRFRAAAALGAESFNIATQAGDKTFEFTSLTLLGPINAALGEFESAQTALDSAEKVAEGFGDTDFRRKCVAFVKLQRAHVDQIAGRYNLSIANFRAAAEYFDAVKAPGFQSYDAHRGLLIAFRESGRIEEVRAELPNVIDIFERSRRAIRDERARNSFFDNESDVYDLAIEFEAAGGDDARAFDFSESSRARSLLDLQSSGASTSVGDDAVRFAGPVVEPVSLSRIVEELPQDVQILQFAVLRKQTLMWRIGTDGTRTAKSEIGGAELEALVGQYRELIVGRGNASERERLAGELYRRLIAPIRGELDPQKELFIVADKSLYKLPFETLGDDRKLIDDFRISYAPSANSFLFCTARAAEFEAAKAERLLSIGDPQFDRAAFGNKLERLPSAADEASDIAAMYPESERLVGAGAARSRVLELMKTSDVMHFAGHFLVDEAEPLRSSLVLAGGSRDASALTNLDVVRAGRNQLKLIILSACETGYGRYYHGEGMTGAARAFLATGVPLVVASQWPVDSAATRILMTEFHRLRKTENLPTSEALRRARLNLKQRGEAPDIWAAFITIGGRASY